MIHPDVHSPVEDEREWLVETLEHSASWHAIKATMYLDDWHKASCARSLYELAEVIRALPPTDPLFRKLAEVDRLYWEEADLAGLGTWLNEIKRLSMQVCFPFFETPNDIIERLAELTDEKQTGMSKGIPS